MFGWCNAEAERASGSKRQGAPGASTVVDYQVPAAGELQMICHLPGHAERGMVGEVVLRPTN